MAAARTGSVVKLKRRGAGTARRRGGRAGKLGWPRAGCNRLLASSVGHRRDTVGNALLSCHYCCICRIYCVYCARFDTGASRGPGLDSICIILCTTYIMHYVRHVD